MAASVTFIGKLTTVIIVALCAFAVIFLLFPAVFDAVFPGQGSAEEAIHKSISRLEQSMSELEMNREDIDRVMDQIDAETVRRVVNESAGRGIESAGHFFDMLKDRIDFGALDTTEIRNIYIERTRDIDFPGAFSQLGDATERGLTRLADGIRELFSR